MAAYASQIFDFLSQHRMRIVERYEISSSAFSILRRSVRFIVLGLRESDETEARELSDRLRSILSEWLTAPIPFDGAILDSLQAVLGVPELVGARWGRDIRAAYEEACKAAQTCSLAANPLRTNLRAVIDQLQKQNQTFRIYCHRRARPYFNSLWEFEGETLINEAFIHSVADYRHVEPFEALIKVGPLRSRGWGSAPDALITAPRFATLIQVVWSGCNDEPGFGYDPVFGVIDSEAATEKATDRSRCYNGLSWTQRVTLLGDDLAALPNCSPDVDEFQLFGHFKQGCDSRRATLVQIDERHGILYPPLSHVLSFDPDSDASKPIKRRLPGETLIEGTFVILPLLAEVDLGGLHAKNGQLSDIWKARLRDELRLNPDRICLQLQNRGVRLLHLRSCVEYWSMAPRAVIHAPQRARDFEILIDVLGLEFAPDQKRKHQAPWWRMAWEEVCRTRGVAIQTGRQKSDLIDEELLDTLGILLPEIRNAGKNNNAFSLPIPAGRSVQGSFRFFKVSLVEKGFLVPDTALKTISEISTIDQWRV